MQIAKTNYTVNGKEYYRVSLEIGRDSNGTRKTKYFYGKNQKDANQKKLEYIKNSSLGLKDNVLYLSATMKIWLYEIIKPGKINPTTFSRYAGIYHKHIENSIISAIQIDKITTLDIQRYYNRLFSKK